MNDAPQSTPMASTDMTDRLADLMERREERWLAVEHPENGRCVALSLAVTSVNGEYWKKADDDYEKKTEETLKRAEAFLAWLKQ